MAEGDSAEQQPQEVKRRFREDLSSELQESVNEFHTTGAVRSLSEALQMIDALKELEGVSGEEAQMNSAVAQAVLGDAFCSRLAPWHSSVARFTDVDMRPHCLAAVTARLARSRSTRCAASSTTARLARSMRRARCWRTSPTRRTGSVSTRTRAAASTTSSLASRSGSLV